VNTKTVFYLKEAATRRTETQPGERKNSLLTFSRSIKRCSILRRLRPKGEGNLKEAATRGQGE
jgi:hypothetical protein